MKSKLFMVLLASFLALAPTVVASTWYVNGVSGSDRNKCLSPTTACNTIKHAISLASSGDTIMIAPATYTENLTIGLSVKLIGSGSGTTIIDGGSVKTAMTISSTSAQVSLSQVTIQHGTAAYPTFDGGAIYNKGVLVLTNSTLSGNIARNGGGVFNLGVLTINTSTISGNRATGIYTSGGGGGIYNAAGIVNINKSTISGNSAGGFFSLFKGGGIVNGGTVTINNSTISGNSVGGLAGALGGAIYNTSKLAVNNSTISGNSATKSGGGIYNGGTARLQNSIVANSTSGGNCSGTMTSNGYNLSSDATCKFTGPGDINNTNPMLGPLQYNGGSTQTMALPSGSPAVDAGNPSGCTDGSGHLLKTDQRGMPRPDSEDTGGCDIGAYERQSD